MIVKSEDTNGDIGGRELFVDNRKSVDIKQVVSTLISERRFSNILQVVGQRQQHGIQEVAVCFLHNVYTQSIMLRCKPVSLKSCIHCDLLQLSTSGDCSQNRIISTQCSVVCNTPQWHNIINLSTFPSIDITMQKILTKKIKWFVCKIPCALRSWK